MTEHPQFLRITEDGKKDTALPAMYRVTKPADPKDKTKEWDQTGDAASHMRYAHTLGLERLSLHDPKPEHCKVIIVGGGPSVEDHLEQIKALAADKNNYLFALNWAHTWLIRQGVIPNACVMFEIDVDPSQIIDYVHPEVTYYICSHCHKATFTGLATGRRVLWHSTPNSPGEHEVFDQLYAGEPQINGGISTFMRSLSIGMALGYRAFEVFGCDSSYPESAKVTHIKGYPTTVDPAVDGFTVWAHSKGGNTVRRFRTVSYLALQTEEFKYYCVANHSLFKMHVHPADTLLGHIHRETYPEQYV